MSRPASRVATSSRGGTVGIILNSCFLPIGRVVLFYHILYYRLERSTAFSNKMCVFKSSAEALWLCITVVVPLLPQSINERYIHSSELITFHQCCPSLSLEESYTALCPRVPVITARRRSSYVLAVLAVRVHHIHIWLYLCVHEALHINIHYRQGRISGVCL